MPNIPEKPELFSKYSGRCTGIRLQQCFGLHQSLHLSVHSVHPHFSVFFVCSFHSVFESCWSPAGFSACLVCCVYTRQSIQVVWEGGGSAPLLKTAHNPVQPLGQFCQLFLTCVHKHTAHSLSFSLRLSLCVLIASNSLHTSPEHAGRINGPSGESWRVARKRGGIGGCIG